MKKYLAALVLYIGIIIVARILIPESECVYSDIVRQMGYDAAETPYEVVEFTIPEKFTPVYEKYNELQKKGGYNLENYKGRKCKRYTYLIESENIRANILVCDGVVIGGDISGITLDGIMIPVKKADND